MASTAEMSKYGAIESSSLDVKETQISNDGKLQSNVQIYGLVALLCAASISEGYDLGVVNGAIVQIQEHFEFESHQVGYIVAVAPFCAFFGALLHGSLADHFGRRVGLVSAVVFLFVGPLVMASATSLSTLLIGRMLCGLGIGGGMLVVTIYVAELTPSSQRGRLVACQEVALNFGMVCGFLMSWILLGIPDDWRWMLMVGSILPLPLIVVLIAVYASGGADDAFLPETPRWLAQQGRFESAYQVLEKYHGSHEASIQITELRAESEQKEEFISWGAILCAWSNAPLMRMLLTGILVASGEMICGGTSIAYYSSAIMKDDLGKTAAYFVTVIIGLVRLSGVIIATLAIDHVGRRTLLLASASVMLVACMWVGVTAHFHSTVVWMLPVGLCLMMLGFVMGLGTVSLVYISEIFPTRVRQKGMVLCMFWCRLGGASCAMAYPILIDRYGISVTFFLQAGVNFVLLSLIGLMVKETKGLSLEQTYKL